MNNFKKVGLTALAGALVSVSANAAELSVTGGASLGFIALRFATRQKRCTPTHLYQKGNRAERNLGSCNSSQHSGQSQGNAFVHS